MHLIQINSRQSGQTAARALARLPRSPSSSAKISCTRRSNSLHKASSLADQQHNSSGSYQESKQNTGDERNDRMPTRLDLFRSSAFLRRPDAQPEEKFVHSGQHKPTRSR